MRRSNSSVTVLPRVLERVPVLIFAGDQDLICNYVGLENMIQGLTWNGATGLGVRLERFSFDVEYTLTPPVDGRNADLDRGWKVGRHLGLRAQLDICQDLQRLPYGWLRRSSRIARHALALHRRKPYCLDGRCRTNPLISRIERAPFTR